MTGKLTTYPGGYIVTNQKRKLTPSDLAEVRKMRREVAELKKIVDAEAARLAARRKPEPEPEPDAEVQLVIPLNGRPHETPTINCEFDDGTYIKLA
jgi:hypothetical protein